VQPPVPSVSNSLVSLKRPLILCYRQRNENAADSDFQVCQFSSLERCRVSTVSYIQCHPECRAAVGALPVPGPPGQTFRLGVRRSAGESDRLPGPGQTAAASGPGRRSGPVMGPGSESAQAPPGDSDAAVNRLEGRRAAGRRAQPWASESAAPKKIVCSTELFPGYPSLPVHVPKNASKPGNKGGNCQERPRLAALRESSERPPYAIRGLIGLELKGFRLDST
jgi:hypothetical protein